MINFFLNFKSLDIKLHNREKTGSQILQKTLADILSADVTKELII